MSPTASQPARQKEPMQLPGVAAVRGAAQGAAPAEAAVPPLRRVSSLTHCVPCCRALWLMATQQDRSFTFILKTPPTAVLLKKAAGGRRWLADAVEQ